MAFQLPESIKTLNPVLLHSWAGPWSGTTETAAKGVANTAIPSAVRLKGLEVILLINGSAFKYWYKNGILDTDLIPFSGGTNVTPAALSKATDDTNITLTLTGAPTTALLEAVTIGVGWTGTLADGRIASATTWNNKQNALNGTGIVKSAAGTISYVSGTSAQYIAGDGSLLTFPTIPSGTWGTLNYPTWVSGTPFVKMDAAGSFILDTTVYQPLLVNPVLGTGTQNFVTKWSTIAGSIADSSIFDNGTNVGIGISTGLTKKFTVDGNIWMKHSSDIKDSGLSMGSQINYITFRPTATGTVGGNDLAVDMFYDKPFAYGTGFNAAAYGVVVQNDGKIVVVGSFTTYRGVSANRIARINDDGTRDTTFNVGGSGFNSGVSVIAIQNDGKTLVGNQSAATYNGVGYNRIIRINDDGTIDTPFLTNIGSGFNASVWAIEIQNDGKILVGGTFTTYQGISAEGIIRLNSDGTTDTAFLTNIGTGTNSGVYSIKVQSDGKILLGGQFTTFNTVSATRIIRLNADGTIDNTFLTNTGNGFNARCNSIAVQSDGKIVCVGDFTTFNVVTSANRIVRLNSDGTVDLTFAYLTGFNNYINSVVILSNGKIIVGGTFTSYQTTTANRIICLNSDATINTTFLSNIGSGFNGTVYMIASNSNGKIFVIGSVFTTFNGASANYIASILSSVTQIGTTRILIRRDSGNVGIGTETPTSKLDVDGTFHTTGQNTLGDLGGFGKAMVVTDNAGLLSTEPIPTGLPPSGTASGDLSGTYPSPTVVKIQGNSISSTAPTTNQVLQYNGSSWVPATITSLSTVYQNEIHVSKDGSDVTGDGTLLKPYATITQGLTLVAGTRKTIVLHPGSYSESPNITVQYTVITTFGLLGGNTEIVGTVSISTGCTISGIKMTNLTISNLTGTGNVNVLNCDISGTLTKSSTGDYTLIRFCDIGTTSITSSAGTVAIFGGNPNFITVNNAGARVVVKNSTTVAPVLTAGSLSLVDCIIFAITGTSNALTAAVGTYTTLANSQLIVPSFTNFARVSIAGFYSIINTIYDRASSTLTGTSTNSIVNSQYINADKFIKQGGTSSQYLMADGSVTTGPLTTKGDLYTFSTVDARLGVGTPGQYLTVDPAEATGLKWVTFTGGGGARIILTANADTTVASVAGTDYVYLVTGAYTITLPTPSATITNSYTIKRTGAGQVTITTPFGVIEGGGTSITINVQNVSLTLVTDGTNWFII
jgi:uncharacterized delta-60 repeat protein